jgi:hypothetical protein
VGLPTPQPQILNPLFLHTRRRNLRVFYFVFELDFVSPKPALSNQAGRLPPFSVPTERVRILSLPYSTTGNCGSKTAPFQFSGGLSNVVKNPVLVLKESCPKP